MPIKSKQGKIGVMPADKGNNPIVADKTGRFGKDRKTLPEYWINYRKQVKARAERGTPEMPTGIGWLDKLTDGVNRGHLWSIAGKSGGGKTSLALSIARNIADTGKTVLFLSLEMSGEELVSRMFCEMTEYDSNELRLGVMTGDFEAKNKVFEETINAMDFEIVEQGYKPKDVFEIVKELYPNKKPDLILIDFLQLIDRSGEDDRIAIENYLRALAELAKTNKTAILYVSQFRRPPSGADINKVPDISDLKGSGAIEQFAYCVLIIYKVITENGPTTTEKTFIKLAKNRGGACGEAEMVFRGANFKFLEVSEIKERSFYDDEN